MSTPALYDLARIGYEAYKAFTGGKTFDGRDMPTWDEIVQRDAENETLVSGAWGAAVEAILPNLDTLEIQHEATPDGGAGALTADAAQRVQDAVGLLFRGGVVVRVNRATDYARERVLSITVRPRPVGAAE